VDEFSRFSGYDAPATLAAEARLIRRADLVITTSQALYESRRKLSHNVVLVTHGVDFEHFAQATRPDLAIPADIVHLPRPILGFWGLLQDWLDIPLLAALARTRPGWSIVLIGEVATDLAALRGLPNVNLLGRRPYAQLPSYARGFDAGLIPFRVDELTRAVNPIKLREYLSAGLPVVSTPLPEVMRYGNLISIAADAEEFVKACEQALDVVRLPPSCATGSGDGLATRQARQTAVRGETWRAKVEEISAHLSRRQAPSTA
jgi:glycosyltransferase involved in cell wall biosynthesis